MTSTLDFKVLLNEKVLIPLGLTRTVFNLDESKKNLLCCGHSLEHDPIAPYLDLGETYASAGALMTTTEELVKALKLFLTPEKLIKELIHPVRKIFDVYKDSLDQPISYGMHVRIIDGSFVFYHPGHIAGHKCSVLISPIHKKIIAYNSTTAQHVQVVWKIFEAL